MWWYGKKRHVYSQERGIGPDGVPRYRKTKKSAPVPEAERVAVPVLDAGIPRDWVLSARKAIAENEWVSKRACYAVQATIKEGVRDAPRTVPSEPRRPKQRCGSSCVAYSPTPRA